MFMHGGVLHIAFNMLFLWIFGNNVEDAMGRGRFLLFYLLAGLAAVYSQAAIDPGATVPTIGASGAIAGVLGAYALLLPRARVLTADPDLLRHAGRDPGLGDARDLVRAPVPPRGRPGRGPRRDRSGGVAYFAHVGGFVFGLALVKLFVRGRPLPGALAAGW